MRKTQYITQKMTLGFAGGMASTFLTVILCIRIDIMRFIPLIILVILSSFIAALTGLFIGCFSNDLMVGIVYIKIVMIFFIAPPILFYLYFPSDSIARSVSYILPSSATFYGLMDLMNGQTRNMSAYLLVLTAHCVVWLLFYSRFSGRRIKT